MIDLCATGCDPNKVGLVVLPQQTTSTDYLEQQQSACASSVPVAKHYLRHQPTATQPPPLVPLPPTATPPQHNKPTGLWHQRHGQEGRVNKGRQVATQPGAGACVCVLTGGLC